VVVTDSVVVVDAAADVVVVEALSAQATASIKRTSRGRFIGGPMI
jgi:hypothetical protein